MATPLQDPAAQFVIQQCRALIPDVTDEALEHAYRSCRAELGNSVADQELVECMVHMLTGEALAPGTSPDAD